jgi:hypothetical protein
VHAAHRTAPLALVLEDRVAVRARNVAQQQTPLSRRAVVQQAVSTHFDLPFDGLEGAAPSPNLRFVVLRITVQLACQYGRERRSRARL